MVVLLNSRGTLQPTSAARPMAPDSCYCAAVAIAAAALCLAGILQHSSWFALRPPHSIHSI